MIFRRVLVALLVTAPALAHATPDPKAGEGELRFSSRLYTEVAQAPGNLFFSPSSIRLALGLAYAGARGETATQMRTVLGLPEGKAAHDQVAAQLKRWDELANPPIPPGRASADPSMQKYYEEELKRRTTTLRVANRLWAQKGAHFREDYLALLKDRYRAAAVMLDLAGASEASRVTINKWVEGETQKKIPQLIPPRMINKDTRSVLTNAIYFKASWQNPFENSDTKDGSFFVTPAKPVKVPLMRGVEHHELAHVDGADVLQLDYGDGKLAMVIVLPKNKDGLAAVEKQLAGGALAGWLKALSGQRVDVTLPRFKIGSSFELGQALKKLGMALAFTFPGADFSGVDDSKILFLSAVVHQAVVAVDEHGTEAAAATAAMMAAGGMPSEPAIFRADHPFVFLIRDKETNAVLFMGRLADPSAK